MRNYRITMNYILVKNLGDNGLDTIICDTNLDDVDIWLMLDRKGIHYDEIEQIPPPVGTIPDGVTFSWYTPMGEYEIQRELVSNNPEALAMYPEWKTLQKR